MRLTEGERAVLSGAAGECAREALDYIVQFGEAFDAEQLVNISYCHYPAEMGIYPGSVEELETYAQRCAGRRNTRTQDGDRDSLARSATGRAAGA